MHTLNSLQLVAHHSQAHSSSSNSEYLIIGIIAVALIAAIYVWRKNAS